MSQEIHPMAQVLRELQFVLGALFGAAVSYFAWTRQFRKEQRHSVVVETAKALGMYVEDATNPEVVGGKKADLAAGKSVRQVVMRPETSSAIAAQLLLVRATFGDALGEELGKVAYFEASEDPTGHKFTETAGAFLKKLLAKV